MSTGHWIDYYKILGIKQDATAKEISSAYKIKAIEYHPDKNASNPSAVQKFHELSKAYQVLTDPEARRAFDTVIISHIARKEREATLSEQRKNMRDDLLKREEGARKRKEEEIEAEERLQRELERLKVEAAAAALAAETEETERKKRTSAILMFDELDRTLRVTAISATSDTTKLSEESILSILEGYGKIESVVMSKKGSTGIVQFSSIITAKAAMMDSDRGLFQKNFLLSWAKGSPPKLIDNNVTATAAVLNPQQEITSHDFESLTLMRMKQRAERDQLRRKLETEKDQPQHNVEEKEYNKISNL